MTAPTRTHEPPAAVWGSGGIDADLLVGAASGPARGAVWGPGGAVTRSLLFAAASRGEGTIVVNEAGGSRRLGHGDPMVAVTVNDRRAYSALLRSGSAGLGAAYVAGWWDAEDLTTLVRVLFRRSQGLRRILDGPAARAGTVLDRLHGAGRAGPSREVDQRNVRAHYDLSNDFFALMLDETMTYSCASFDGIDVPLGQAQVTKLDGICRRLELGPADHVIEVGTGWGAFAIHAASRYGCRVTTTTISAAQRVEAERRIAAAGLADRVTVLGQDWRDLGGRYDALVSVEMIEAVDWRHHDAFLAACAGLLVDDGRALLQAIVIDDRSFERAKHHRDFVKRMVFPGGCLPSRASLVASVTRATDLGIAGREEIGNHYPATLRGWAANLEERSAAVDRLRVSTSFRRLWALYLAYCEASFLEGHIGVVQLTLAKPGWRPARSAAWRSA